jgi:flagellar biosynthetic protein FliR
VPDALTLPLAPFTLAFFRVGGLMLVAPLFSSRTVPAQVRASLAVLLTLLLLPGIGPLPEGFVLGPAAILVETFVGFGIGFGAAVLLASAELAGEVLAVQTGLSGATALDPLSGQGTGVLSQLLGLFVLLLFLVTGGHLVLIEVLAGSYEIVPVGQAVAVSDGIWALARVFGLLFAQGLQFASPVIAAVSVGYMALGVLARTSPQLNMLAVAFPLQIGIGLLVLGSAFPIVATFYAAWPDHAAGLAGRFLTSLVGG